MKRLVLVTFLAALPSVLAAQAEKLDFAALARIRDEGLTRSQVMDHISWLADVYGPRLTGSPQIQQASDWAMKKFRDWGLANVHQEKWAFGKGWSLVRFSAHMIEPQVQPLIGAPHEWSAPTKGTVTADVIRAEINSEADFPKFQGKLAGKILLTQPARQVRMIEGPIILKMTNEWTNEAAMTPIPAAGRGRGGAPGAGAGGGRGGPGGAQGAAAFRQKLSEFLAAEGVVATLDRGADSDLSAGGSDLSWQQQRPDGGTLFPGGAGARDEKAGKGVPEVTLAVEHYNRMVRLLHCGNSRDYRGAAWRK